MKNWGKNIIALAIGLLIGLLVLEIFFRIFPNRYSGCGPQFKNRYDELVGWWNVENQKGVGYITPCFQVCGINTNSWGMRDDKERRIERIEGVCRIAILGDSFMQAVHVENDKHFSAVLEGILGDKVEVLNFGMGGFGTTQEYLTYTHKARLFKPDIVILAFFLGNDVMDNSKKIQSLFSEWGFKYRPYYLLKEGNLILQQVPRKTSVKKHVVLLNVKNWLKKHFRVAVFINKILKEKLLPLKIKSEKKCKKYWFKSCRYVAYDVYRPPPNEMWKEAWYITEKVILKLKNAVERDGAKFIVMFIPDILQADENPKKRIEEELGIVPPHDFDPLYPLERMINFCEENKIVYLDLLPEFLKYRDQFHLKYPYFSYPCNGHWNPLGHHLAASLAGEFLVKNGLIDEISSKRKKDIIQRIEEDLKKSPEEILGEKIYKRIYTGKYVTYPSCKRRVLF